MEAGAAFLDRIRFADVDEIVARFPAEAATRIVDAYLSDEPSASIRVFRLYDALPAHRHAGCDEMLFLLRGRCRLTVEDMAARELGAAGLVLFPRGAAHAIAPIGDAPVVFLTADTPRRAPSDVRFVDAAEAEVKPFVSHLPGWGPRAGAASPDDREGEAKGVAP